MTTPLSAAPALFVRRRVTLNLKLAVAQALAEHLRTTRPRAGAEEAIQRALVKLDAQIARAVVPVQLPQI